MQENKISSRPDMRSVIGFGEYLRAERLRLGYLSVDGFVKLLEDTTGIGITPRRIYNLESAAKQALNAIEIAAISAMAANLYKKKIYYLINPKTGKPFNTNELIGIAHGLLSETGEKIIDCQLF